VQTNQPEAIVAAAGMPAPSTIVRDGAKVCLVNRDNGLGFPTKEIAIDSGTVVAGKGGCADVPAGTTRASFAGDGAVTPSSAALTAVGATVPATLSLTVGSASFGAFTPGVGREYTATTTATVTSTAADATLSVSDPGHLANGAFTLVSPLQVAFGKTSWTGPVANEPVPVTFKQTIGAGEALRTGAYTRTLTFTLSTTAP
jgi:hypothetical protein